ncbi:MAG: acylneuraminate cytidylyltransferase [Chloroflexi bacterium]|nr:acylneuraminate cytidylyltransferase [Chloroflexota bacterium]
MAKQPEVLAIIPARGGSKTIPGKNIQPFVGYPLIAYSIAAALQAEGVTRTIVSTDSEEIAAVARQYGAELPFMRPAEHAQDDTIDLPVFQHALAWLAENENYHPNVVIQLRPTSPLRPPGLIDRALDLLQDHPEADSVRGVVLAGQSPHKMWQLKEGAPMQPLLRVEGIPESHNAPRQALPDIYWQTGHIDAIRAATILDKGSMSGSSIYPLLIDPSYTVDIDTLNDLHRAAAYVTSEQLDIVWPSRAPRPLPADVRLLVLDFDGTLTDDRVWVDAEGREQVAAHRGEGYGIGLLKTAGIQVYVLSKERNSVVAARCQKLGIPFQQGVDDKASALSALLKELKIPTEQVVFAGHDVKDLPCFELVACAAVVADAHPEVLRAADLRLTRPGGRGAVRELCDLILSGNSTATHSRSAA